LTIALPMTLLSKIRLPFRQKVGLVCIFSLALLWVRLHWAFDVSYLTRTCSCAILRIYYVYLIYYGSYDVGWNAGPAIWTSGCEACLGVICASIPTLRVFFRGFFGESSSSSSSPNRSYQRKQALAQLEP
jgi:hypothetical protein